MAAISSGVAKPALSKITETRYCILGHLLWFGAPLVGGRSPKVGEVLLVSNVGRSWPYGWNRSVIYCVTYVTCSGVARPLHTAGARPVDLARYALREGSRFDQVKRHVRAGV